MNDRKKKERNGRERNKRNIRIKKQESENEKIKDK